MTAKEKQQMNTMNGLFFYDHVKKVTISFQLNREIYQYKQRKHTNIYD